MRDLSFSISLLFSIHSKWLVRSMSPLLVTGMQSDGTPLVMRAYRHSWGLPWWIFIRSRMNLQRVTMTISNNPIHCSESVLRWYPTGRMGRLRGIVTIFRANSLSNPPVPAIERRSKASFESMISSSSFFSSKLVSNRSSGTFPFS